MLRNNKKKRKIAIIAGSRGEYGYFRPILREIVKNPLLDYGIIATNMHVLDRFGSSIDEIKKDGFKIEASIHNTFDGYNRMTMTKSLSVFMLQLPEILEQMGADMMLLAGDRGEQLMAAIVGAHLYIPIAHIQGGEVSGNIDGTMRHAITKIAHLHFASSEDAARRIKRMGEDTFRTYNVGAPQLDELLREKTASETEVRRKFSLVKNKPVILVVQHPVTEEFEHTEKSVETTLKAVAKFNAQTVVILSNSDAGSQAAARAVSRNHTENMQVHANVPRADYLGLMKIADVIVGNSSSGLIEAPSYKLPAVNIGNRQRGRLQGENVINVGYVEKDIINAIKKAMSPQFKKRIKTIKNPYGDGRSSKRIVEVLATVPIDERLLVKQISY